MSIHRPFRAAEKRNFGTVPGRMAGSYRNWHYGDMGNSGARAVEKLNIDEASDPIDEDD